MLAFLTLCQPCKAWYSTFTLTDREMSPRKAKRFVQSWQLVKGETWAGSKAALLALLEFVIQVVEDLGRRCVPRTSSGAWHRPGYLHAWVIISIFLLCFIPPVKAIVSGEADAPIVVAVRLCDLES